MDKIDGRIAANKVRCKITDEQILEAIKTMTRQEIADKYGVHVENLARRMKRLGVHAVIKYSNQYGNAETKETWHETPNSKEFVESHTAGKFEFVAYKKGTYKIRCKECGKVFERVKSTFYKNNIRCENCQTIKKESVKREKKLAIQIEESKEKVCAVCGKAFHSIYPTQKYCGKRCKRIAIGGTGHKKRAKHYGVEYTPNITLKKVYDRFDGVCQICGNKTDWNSNEWNGYNGAKYPTIDHIYPMSKGGSHTWDNVQLACGLCNSYKRDLIAI